MGGSIFALIAIWGLITHSTVPTNIAYLALAATFIWAGFRAWRKEVQENTRLRISLSSLPSTQPVPIFVNEEPSFLTKFFNGHTSIQATMLLKPYIGKWMRLSEVAVRDISNSGVFNPQPRVSGQSKDGTLVFMGFEEAWHERILILRAGSVIEIIGQITHIDSSGMAFDKCEIVSGAQI